MIGKFGVSHEDGSLDLHLETGEVLCVPGITASTTWFGNLESTLEDHGLKYVPEHEDMSGAEVIYVEEINE